VPADKKRKGFNDKGRLVGNDLARLKRIVKEVINNSGGTSLVPTTLPLHEQSSNTTGKIVDLMAWRAGASLGASVNSSSWTETINLTGPLIVDFLGVVADSSTTAITAEIKITIDGVVVAEDSTGSLSDDEFAGYVGSFYWDDVGGDGYVINFGQIEAKTSLVVEVKRGSGGAIRGVYRHFKT